MNVRAGVSWRRHTTLVIVALCMTTFCAVAPRSARAQRAPAAGHVEGGTRDVLRNAEAALSAGPFSVMQKHRVPPSGDRHDFMSLAPYWWPDPAKPGGLPYIRRDGEVNPESKVDVDDVRFGEMQSAVSALTDAYLATHDERYASRAALLLRTWFLDPATRMNPHLEYGQAVPGHNSGRAAGIIATRRLVNTVASARALAGSSAWTAADDEGLKQWCLSYVRWLRTSRIGRDERAAENNHGTWYDAQVIAMLLYAGRTGEARDVVESSTKARLASQIQPDGRQPEELARTRAWSYSVMNLTGWFTLARLAGEAGVDLWTYRTADGRSIRAAVDYLVPYADQSRKWPYPQITAFETGDFAALLCEAAARWRDPRYADLASRLAAR